MSDGLLVEFGGVGASVGVLVVEEFVGTVFQTSRPVETIPGMRMTGC